MMAQTSKSKLYRGHCGGLPLGSWGTFLLRTPLPCVWEQFLFRPQSDNIMVIRLVAGEVLRRCNGPDVESVHGCRCLTTPAPASLSLGSLA